MHLHVYTHLHAYTHLHTYTMDQQSNVQAPSHESMRTMELTGVMPQCIQLAKNTPQPQTPLHLPFLPSASQSHPLPSIPTTVHIESQNPIFSSQNIENCHFPLHNNEKCPFPSHNNENHQFLPTNQAFYSQNNQYRPVYDTQAFSSTYVNMPTGPPSLIKITSTQCNISSIIFSLPLVYHFFHIPPFTIYLQSRNPQLPLPLLISPFSQEGWTGVLGLRH